MSTVRRRVLVLAGLLLAAVLVVTGVVGATTEPGPAPTDATAQDEGPDASGGPTSAEPSPDPEVEVREVEANAAERVGSVVPAEPRQVRLPGTRFLDVVAVGTRSNGILDVPDDVDLLGWWEGGSRVGDPFGSVLVAGHVDSETEGLGPSAVLLTSARGDRVTVRAGGRTTRYDVVSRDLVPLDDLASYPRVLSSAGPGRLTLVTCAPPFVRARGGYQNLAVVTARPAPGGSG